MNSFWRIHDLYSVQKPGCNPHRIRSLALVCSLTLTRIFPPPQSGVGSVARGIAGGVQETAGDLSSRAGSLARAAHLDEIAHGVQGAAGNISNRVHDIAHEAHLDEIAHGVQGKFEDGLTSVRQGVQSVRPDSFKGGAMGDSAGSGAEWWNLGNITQTLSQLPSSLQQAPNFFQGNPNTKPGSRQGVDGDGGVWGGV